MFLIQLAAVCFVSFFLNVLSQEFLSEPGRFLNVIASSNNEQFPSLCLCLSVSLPFISPPSTSWELICCLPRDICFLFSQTQLCYSSFTLPYGVVKSETETISKSSFTDEIVTDGFIYFSSHSSQCSCLKLVATHCLLCVKAKQTWVKSVIAYYLSSDTSKLRKTLDSG